jgi:3-isopropylmalate dehydrogenase
MAETLKVLALGGDGIGPEVVDAGLKLLDAALAGTGLRLAVDEDLLGGASWEAHGTFCRDEVAERAKAADAVLVGAVGGPKWDSKEIAGDPAEKDGLMRLRRDLEVFACLRPARAWEPLIARTPYRREVVAGADVMVLRELCGGLLFAEPRGIEALPGGGHRGYDTNLYTSDEIARVARVGFALARRRRGRLTSIDKANVLESGFLWRRVVGEVGARDHPAIALEHLYADNALYQLVRDPRAFDVILGDNLLGDLISDLAGSLAGSLGMLPSASLKGLAPEGARNPAGIFEPVHGSAPDIACQGIANPMGAILSVAMMLDYAFARPDLASRVEAAVEAALARGVATPDLGGESSTADATDAVLGELRRA